MMSQSHVQIQQGNGGSGAGGFYYRGDSNAVMNNVVNTGTGINASAGAGGVSLQQQQDFVNALISVLEVPKDATSVAAEYANDKNTASEVQAYAKIAGKDWTYYLKDIVINIGRNTSPGDASVDIDLGPAKVVSRQHATIKFNSNSALWELHVTGRNGAKVNFHRINSGPNSVPHPLSSGSILDIGGTQMMFILPDQGLYIDPNAVAHLTPKLFMAYYNVTTNPLLRNLFQSNPDLIHSLELSSPSRNGQLGVSSQTQMLPQSSQSHLHSHGNGQPSVRAFKMYDAPDSAMRSQLLSESTGQMYGSNGASNGHGMSHSNGSSDMSNGQLYGTIANTGFNIASTDVSTDLSRDENRNIKPPHSYATMITQAILSTEEGELSLSDIYKHIANHYSYYRYTKAGWQNSIRHNLSLNKAFEKVPRKPGEPGKGMKWRISEETQRDFLEKWQNGKIGKVRRGSSVTRQLQAHMYRFNSLPIQRETFSFNDQSKTNVKPQSSSSSHSDYSQTPKLEKSLQSLQPHSQSSLHQTSPPVPHPPIPSYSQQDHTSSNYSTDHSHQSDLPAPKRQHLNPPSQHSQHQQPALPPPSSGQTRSPNHQQMPSNVSSTGSLLHSPNKHFQVNAVEAYTPERGSNLQKSPQPILNLPSLPQATDMGQSTSRSDSNALQLPTKSSPGVMNLLQFSSVNNTPSTNLQRTPVSHPQVTENLDGKDSKSNMLAVNNAFQESNSINEDDKTNLLSARNVQDENDEDEGRIMSSPIKVKDNRNNQLVVDPNENSVIVKTDQ
ncbi:forkhead family transcription factor FKH1 [Kluyveromyces lactis]|uniref:KLLA0F04631p n=1 Tax=Kluyveromyces lactis (strain ATCC 8585 / CBS 2359 / DSM 70799 / NBRC 1267 / NRRL Y-1140 / WM37) TaxID=284590 RepID=Q6CLA0_KLULA|nr:uncharacterized protein KLLA0_F04631g [Kluyveromyces lactis]CAG97997.1 KLLA0F04631p [Kluyveromyces lactis]|eukprot:XP_455289.1 uncharacterized protein KLLA0_F04631g [Kluyveromyces lactis]